MTHLDQRFEADFQISQTHVKQGNRQVPGWELHSFSHLYRRFTSSSHLGEVLPGVFVSSSCKRSLQDLLEIPFSPQQLSAVLNRIIGSCLDHTAGLSSFSIRYCCHSSDISFHT